MVNNRFLIAPSILAADFSKLGEEIRSIESSGADWVHVDVMDGHFVPNLTIGAPVVKCLKPITTLPLDVHLMIEQPEKYIEDFAKAGADYITVHIEAIDGAEVLENIRSLGCKVGLSLRPGTTIDSILPYLPKVDLVLVMTVEPGFGGQSFMTDQVAKIDRLAKEREEADLDFLIEVDGGVTDITAQHCKKADVLVAGSYVFKNNYSEAIQKLKDLK